MRFNIVLPGGNWGRDLSGEVITKTEALTSEDRSSWGLELRAEAKFAKTKTGRFPA